MNQAKFNSALTTFKSATYWKSTGSLGKGYGVAYKTEADKVAAYLQAVGQGLNPTPPVCTTLHGQGLVGLVSALVANPTPVGGSNYGVSPYGGADYTLLERIKRMFRKDK